ncbi:MAG: phosphotransferase family protein [Ilumatobacteraceae bacterium]
MADETRARLAEQLSAVMGGARIDDLRRLSGGASRETWTFAADGDSLVLQRTREGGLRRLDVEVAVLRAAAAAGVPVPEVILDGSRSDALERPYMVVREVPGETIARKILRDDVHAAAREVLPRQLAHAAARLHGIDVSGIDGLAADDQIAQYRTVLDESGEVHPVFEAAFRWLEMTRPAPSAPRLVHGDFRLGNVIVGETGLAAVLDWELVHLGDPIEDLGWLCVRAWRFGSTQPVAGLGGYDELLDAYAEVSGVRPTRDTLRWWEVLGTLKWGIMCIVQSQTHLRGVVRSHELAAIGRRVCENEYDLITLLEGALS